MDLNTRKTTYLSGRNIFYDVVGMKLENITLDFASFGSGVVPAGTAIAINKISGKAEKWNDLTSTGEAMVTKRDIRLVDKDVVTVGVVAGYIKASACTGVTDKFKAAAKMLYFK